MIEITQQSSNHLSVVAYVERLINGDTDAKRFLQNPGKELEKLGFDFNGCDGGTPSFDEILQACKQGFAQALTVDVGASVAVGVGISAGVSVTTPPDGDEEE